MRNFAAEDFAYEMATDHPELSVDEIADRIAERFHLSAEDAYDIADEAVEEYEAYRYADGDWDAEMGFDPYEGCYTGDC